MAKTRLRTILEHAFGVGYFPHELSFLINNPFRRLLITPGTLADRLPLRPASRVLELGPGSGYFSAEVARRIPKGRLELADLQPEMLVKARRNLASAHVSNAGYTACEASALPFPRGHFDVAFLVAVLGEVPDQEACIESLHRVLRPRGVLVIHEHLPDPDFSPLGKLRRMVEGEGFSFERRWGFPWNYTASFRRPARGDARRKS